MNKDSLKDNILHNKEVISYLEPNNDRIYKDFSEYKTKLIKELEIIKSDPVLNNESKSMTIQSIMSMLMFELMKSVDKVYRKDIFDQFNTVVMLTDYCDTNMLDVILSDIEKFAGVK